MSFSNRFKGLLAQSTHIELYSIRRYTINSLVKIGVFFLVISVSTLRYTNIKDIVLKVFLNKKILFVSLCIVSIYYLANVVKFLKDLSDS